MATRTVRQHVFVADRSLRSDYRGQRYCAVDGCGLPERNRVHREAPEADPAEARRVGEGGGDGT